MKIAPGLRLTFGERSIALFCAIYVETLQVQERHKDAIVTTEDVENEDDTTAIVKKDLEKMLSREPAHFGLTERLSALNS